MRVEGTPYPLGAPPYLVGTSCALRTPFSYTTRILVSKNSLYNPPGVLTPVSRKYLLSLFRVVLLQIRATCHPRIRKEKATWLITLQILRSMGMWSIAVGLRKKKRTINPRERRRRAEMKMKSHYLNLGTCMFKKSSLPDRVRKPKIEFIPFRLLQENKQELCKKILSLEQEIDDLRDQNFVLKRKLRKKPTPN